MHSYLSAGPNYWVYIFGGQNEKGEGLNTLDCFDCLTYQFNEVK